MGEPVVEEQPLTSMEWSVLCVLNQELTTLKIKKQPSNEEQVVIDWMQSRLDYLNSRRQKH